MHPKINLQFLSKSITMTNKYRDREICLYTKTQVYLGTSRTCISNNAYRFVFVRLHPQYVKLIVFLILTLCSFTD